MNTLTRSRIQMFGAWCGFLYPVGLIVGWWLVANFVPPHSPSAGADEIAAIFKADYTRIRIGMVILMFTAMIIIPFSGVVSQFLTRIEGSAGVLTYSVLLGGVSTAVLTFYPAVWWLTICFRPERGAELIYLLNDMSWLQLIGGIAIFLPLPGGVTVAAFCDASNEPVFPRWAGYFSAWVILLVLPDQLLFFFHSGPFAWNGLIGLWIPLVVFGSWFFVMWYLLRKAILRERPAGTN